MWELETPSLRPTVYVDSNNSILLSPTDLAMPRSTIRPPKVETFLDDFEDEDFDMFKLLSRMHSGKQDNLSYMLNLTSILESLQGNRSASHSVFKQVVDSLHLYFTPIIIIVGLIGNTMSLLVFSLTHLQRLSSSFYLSSLAIADLGFLLTLFLVWLNRIGVDLYTTEVLCKFLTYIYSVCGFMAIWNVVSFTMERYIIVYHPLRKDSFCTKRKARIVVLFLTVFALSLYCYKFWIYDVFQLEQKRGCGPIPKYYDVMTVLTCVDTLFACVIPSLLIVLLNIRIMIKIHQYQSRRGETPQNLMLPSAMDIRRRSMVHTSISTTGSMHIKFSSSRLPERNSASHWQEVLGAVPPGNKKKLLRGQTQFRTARMLLILSSVFVLMNLPGYAFKVQNIVSRVSGGNHKTNKSIGIWNQVFEIVYFLNFAINFFIYSACGRQFRTGMRRLCKKWKYKVAKCGNVLPLANLFARGHYPDLDRPEADGYNLKAGAGL